MIITIKDIIITKITSEGKLLDQHHLEARRCGFEGRRGRCRGGSDLVMLLSVLVIVWKWDHFHTWLLHNLDVNNDDIDNSIECGRLSRKRVPSMRALVATTRRWPTYLQKNCTKNRFKTIDYHSVSRQRQNSSLQSACTGCPRQRSGASSSRPSDQEQHQRCNCDGPWGKLFLW